MVLRYILSLYLFFFLQKSTHVVSREKWTFHAFPLFFHTMCVYIACITRFCTQPVKFVFIRNDGGIKMLKLSELMEVWSEVSSLENLNYEEFRASFQPSLFTRSILTERVCFVWLAIRLQ